MDPDWESRRGHPLRHVLLVSCQDIVDQYTTRKTQDLNHKAGHKELQLDKLPVFWNGIIKEVVEARFVLITLWVRASMQFLVAWPQMLRKLVEAQVGKDTESTGYSDGYVLLIQILSTSVHLIRICQKLKRLFLWAEASLPLGWVGTLRYLLTIAG